MPAMRRRRFLLTTLAGALAAPGTTAAQRPGRTARVAMLLPASPAAPGRYSMVEELGRRLADVGWAEGRSVIIETRYAEGRPERLPALAADLVRAGADVIVAVSPPAIRAAHEATREIPIVMAFSGIDPVRAGFVASLARPGGNVTGVTILANDVTVKRLEVLKTALPGARRVAVLSNPRNPSTAAQLGAVRTAAPALGVEIREIEIERSGDYARTPRALERARAQALLVPSDPEFYRDAPALVEIAAQRALPAAYEWREFVELGGLLSFGPSIRDLAARVSVYVDRLLRGARPTDLPVEQPATFELVVSRRTARRLGLTLPPAILAQAQVLE
jgi:putative ABC transport system substrate-binding protein